PLQGAQRLERGIESAQRGTAGKLCARGAGVEIAVSGGGSRAEARLARLDRRERPGRREPAIDHRRDRDRPLVVARELRLRAAAEPFAVANEALEDLPAGVPPRRIPA